MNVLASQSAVALMPAATMAMRPAPEVCIVVPTFNELANISILVERLRLVLASCNWEVVFVDDNSPDGTAAAVRAIGEADARVRCIHRIGRRGLAGACLEGMLSTQARYIAVMDADLQHDEMLLVAMLGQLRTGNVDLVVASRYLRGPSAAGLSRRRARLSSWSNVFVQRTLGIDLTDPLSGYFMMRRDAFEPLAPTISSQGFKILLDIVASGNHLRTVELPTTFRKRRSGESKLDNKVALDFATLVTMKLTNDAVSPRFLLFCLVGFTGIGIHLSILVALLGPAILSFGLAQAFATIGAITWNFTFNNLFTYRDKQLTGWRCLIGLMRFQVICAIGAVSNVGIAAWIYDFDGKWWVAGLGGALIGAVWNFVVSDSFVWRQH